MLPENPLKILSAWVKALETNRYGRKPKRGHYRGLTHYDMGFLAGFVTGTLGKLPSNGYPSKSFKLGYQAIWFETMRAWKALESNPPHTGVISVNDAITGWRYFSMNIQDAIAKLDNPF